MSGLQDARDAGEGRDRPQVRQLSPGVSDQGRHSGHADRRSHGRALNPRAILLVRLRMIGDVVFTTPILAALKQHFPDARLTYLVENAAAPVVRHNPHIDDLMIVGRPRGFDRLRYDWTLGRRLRRERFDIAIDLHGGPRAAWLTRASAAPMRIGYALPGRRLAYTHRVAWTRSLLPPRHSVLNQWDLLGPLGIGPADPARNPVTMALDPVAIQRVDERLRDAGLSNDARLAV